MAGRVYGREGVWPSLPAGSGPRQLDGVGLCSAGASKQNGDTSSTATYLPTYLTATYPPTSATCLPAYLTLPSYSLASSLTCSARSQELAARPKLPESSWSGLGLG